MPLITGAVVAVGAAFLPVEQLAAISNGITLYAFAMVAIAVMVLRKTQPDAKLSFRTPVLWLVGPATIVGCIFPFVNLPYLAMAVLPLWGRSGC